MAEILDNKHPSSPSVFRATALLREARRQKGLSTVDVPTVCILDPDGASAAAPPSPAINVRRFIRSPRLRGPKISPEL
jgi:hypothetical protein